MRISTIRLPGRNRSSEDEDAVEDDWLPDNQDPKSLLCVQKRCNCWCYLFLKYFAKDLRVSPTFPQKSDLNYSLEQALFF